MASPVVLILGAGPFQLEAIKAAAEIGAVVWTVDNNPSSPGHTLSKGHWIRSTLEPEAIVQDWAAAGRPPPDAVLAPCTDLGLFSLAAIASHWGLPGPSPELVMLACDKVAFRSWQAREGFPCPEFSDKLPNSPGQLPGGGPWLVKPRRASGTRGVKFCSNWSEVQSAWGVANEQSWGGGAVVEAWVCGRQLTAEGFWASGQIQWLGITDRVIPSPELPLTSGHDYPADLGEIDHASIAASLRQILSAADFASGFFDADLVWDGRESFVLEWAPRLGGNRLVRLWKALGGPDVAREAVLHALGESMNPKEWPSPRPGFVRLLGCTDSSVITFNPEKLPLAPLTVPGLIEIEVSVPPGSLVPAWRDGRSSLGHVIGEEAGISPELITREALEFCGWTEHLREFPPSRPVQARQTPEPQTVACRQGQFSPQ